MDDFELDAELALEEELFSYQKDQDQDEQPPDDVDISSDIAQPGASDTDLISKAIESPNPVIALNQDSIRRRELVIRYNDFLAIP